MTEEEVHQCRQGYDPNGIIASDPDIQSIMHLLESGHFNSSEPGIFSMLTAGLRSAHDPWVTIGDLRSYIDAQKCVNDAYKDQQSWNRMSIINSATSGWFSSDRTIQQYADEIWKVGPVR